MKILQYEEKTDVVDQFRHANSTPLLLNNMEDTVNSTVRHLFEQNERIVREVLALRKENETLRQLCKQHGVAVPRRKRCA